MDISKITQKTIVLSILTILFSGCGDNKKSPRPKPPNIVLIFADDLGYGDVGVNNPESKIKTPNLDNLAKTGINFIDAHTSSAVCTPSRYSLLTGRYPWRSSKKRGVLRGYDKGLMPVDQPTLASLLKAGDYITGIVGKWHLGLGWQPLDSAAPEAYGNVDYSKPLTYSPNDAGFDYSYIIPASLDFSPYVYIENKSVTVLPSDTIQASKFPVFYRKAEISPGFDHAETLDHLLDKAVSFIDESSEKDRPFFLYFPLTAPHKPLLPHDRFKGKTDVGWYGDFISQVDWTIGQVIEGLEKNNLTENTIVIFSSDNGSYMRLQDCSLTDHLGDSSVQAFCPDNHRPNYPWRGTKADIYEAGHRVPLMVKWPKGIKNTGASDKTVCLSDLAATLAELTGQVIDRTQMEDSYSFAHVLLGMEGEERPPVIHQSGNGMLAIRKGDWKMILGNGSGGREKPAGRPFNKPYQLYDLGTDPTEDTSLWQEGHEQAIFLEDEFYKIVGNSLNEKDIKVLRGE